MKEQDYYALIQYRNRKKYYHVKSHEDDDIRIEYIDYKADRNRGTWITKGKDKIIEKYEQGSPEYEYFNNLKAKFYDLVEKLAEEKKSSSEDKTLPDIFYYAEIGTFYIRKAYEEAYRMTVKPEHINF